MLESIHLKNYRCFADTQIDDLKQITLISGKNNAECFLIQMLQPLIREDTIFDSIQIWDFGGISQLSQTLRTLPP
jgi:predicted ATPase